MPRFVMEGAREAWCYIVVFEFANLWHVARQNYICDVAVPRGFARPWWKVPLSLGEGKRRKCGAALDD